MAYVVERPGGRYEIRESSATPKGPRSRTLASFRVLTDEVLDHAESRSAGAFDRERIWRRAGELGAPRRRVSVTSRLARDLIAHVRRGDRPSPVLASALKAELGRTRREVPDSVEPMLDWLDAGPERRGRALRDLLRLAGRIPRRRRARRPAFPRIVTPGAR